MPRTRSAHNPARAIAVLGTQGRIRRPDRFDAATLLTALGANAGNLIFQYAAARLLDGPLTFFGGTETPYDDRAALEAARIVVFPAANHLRLGADWAGLCDWLEAAKKPIVVLGLGAQALAEAEVGDTVAALDADASVRRLVAVLRDNAALITVRGPFSQAVCDGLGLPDTLPLGCPSALLNPDPTLGQTLARKLAALGRQPAPRLSLAAAAPFEIALDPARRGLEQRLMRWVRAADGLYVQQSGGETAFYAATGARHQVSEVDQGSLSWVLDPDGDPDALWAYLARRGQFFTAAADWIAAIGAQDLVLGSRAHGVMAALAAGTPAALIHHDARTSELAETMHLPTLSAEAVQAASSLQDVLPHIHFDPAAFDAWRTQTASTLAQAFDRLDLPLNPSVRALAHP